MNNEPINWSVNQVMSQMIDESIAKWLMSQSLMSQSIDESMNDESNHWWVNQSLMSQWLMSLSMIMSQIIDD